MENSLQTPSKVQELSKEQLAKDAEGRRLKKQLKETLWPFLEMSCKDLSEAMTLVDLVELGIEAAWNFKKGKATLKSIDVKMREDAADYKKVKFLLDELSGETVSGAVSVLKSIKNLLNSYGSKASLDSLKTYFDAEFRDV
jgi:hypothetical protein